MMRFASRTDWSFTPNPLTAAIEKRRHSGLPILDLTESNPTRCGFVYDAPEILSALADPRSLNYAPDPRGLLQAREAVAAYYAEGGIEVRPEQVFLTTSTSEAYSYAFRLLADPGSEVLVPQPSYPLFDFLARLDSVELAHYPLAYDASWRIDQHVLEETVGSRTRAILTVSPNNPTGSFLHRGELEFLVACAGARALALIADEVFADYRLDTGVAGHTHPLPDEALAAQHPVDKAKARVPTGGSDADPVASLATTREVLTLTLSGLSKISALPQMKLAWLVVNGPEEILRDAMARLEVIADTYLSVSTPLAYALPRLLETRRSMQPQILDRLRSNLLWLDHHLEAPSPVGRLRSEGGWYAVLKVPTIKSDEDWALEILGQDGVLVHPGHFYDFPTEGHLVASLLPQPETFQHGIDKILTRVERTAR